MNSYLVGICVVLFSTVVAVSGMIAVRHRVGVATLVTYHEVAGYLLSVVGTLYAVLLGFIIVEAMQHTQDLRLLVEQEASGVANIFLVSSGLPSERKTAIRNLCKSYVEAVVNEEWRLMETGGYSAKAFGGAWGLWEEITHLDPKTVREEALQQQLLSEICNMTEKRRTRLVNALHGLSPVMWYVLVVGGVFTVIFTYFFGLTHLRAQVIMTSLVALTLSLNLFVLYMLSTPFSGELAVRPDAFRLDLAIFEHFQDKKMPSREELFNPAH